ncbi:hypothetical protein B0H21DRAFT_192580 [Amylocystis lapponica]|nr:hypothetical protein B0H21DRAFT_192580 [Amylocystis lapponica]
MSIAVYLVSVPTLQLLCLPVASRICTLLLPTTFYAHVPSRPFVDHHLWLSKGPPCLLHVRLRKYTHTLYAYLSCTASQSDLPCHSHQGWIELHRRFTTMCAVRKGQAARRLTLDITARALREYVYATGMYKTITLYMLKGAQLCCTRKLESKERNEDMRNNVRR